MFHMFAVKDSPYSRVEPLRVGRGVVKGFYRIVLRFLLLFLNFKKLFSYFKLNKCYEFGSLITISFIWKLIKFILLLISLLNLILLQLSHILHHNLLKPRMSNSFYIGSYSLLEINIILLCKSICSKFIKYDSIEFNDHVQFIVFMICLVK